LSVVILFGALVWIMALVILFLGIRFRGSRFARVRWIAVGLLVSIAGSEFSTFALLRNWPYRQQAIASNVEGLSYLASMICFVLQFAIWLRPRAKKVQRH